MHGEAKTDRQHKQKHTDRHTDRDIEKTTRNNNEGYRNGVSHQGSGGWGERTSMGAEDGRRITDENLSKGMAIGEETSPNARREFTASINSCCEYSQDL